MSELLRIWESRDNKKSFMVTQRKCGWRAFVVICDPLLFLWRYRGRDGIAWRPWHLRGTRKHNQSHVLDQKQRTSPRGCHLVPQQQGIPFLQIAFLLRSYSSYINYSQLPSKIWSPKEEEAKGRWAIKKNNWSIIDTALTTYLFSFSMRRLFPKGDWL